MSWQQTFDDEFNGTTLDLTKWQKTDYWGLHTDLSDQQCQCYLDQEANVVGNGVATLEAQNFIPPGCNPDPGTLQYISGEITTADQFQQTYGYFEIRAQLPEGAGLLPQFKLVVPGGVFPPTPLTIAFDGIGSKTYGLYNVPNTNMGGVISHSSIGLPEDGSFHTYGVDWEPGAITWYVDGKALYKYTGSDVYAGPLYLQLDLAVGGLTAGQADASVLPAMMNIDYARVWQKVNDGAADQPPPGAIDGSVWAIADKGAVVEGQQLVTSAATGVLANDVDANGGQVSVQSVSHGSNVTAMSGSSLVVAGDHGTLTLAPDGSYTYSPDSRQLQPLNDGQTLTDTFAYTAGDVNGTDTAALTITLTAHDTAPAAGTPIPQQNELQGAAFTFQVPTTAFTDPDTVYGDSLTYSVSLSGGGALPSWLHFDPGTNTFSGTPSGSQDALTIVEIATDSHGEQVSSSFAMTIGFVMNGGNGPQTLTGGAGNDVITGGRGTQTLDGGAGDDTITAGTGTAKIVGGTGNDTLIAGNGLDTFIFHTGFGHDVIKSFNPTLDVLQFDKSLFPSFAAVAACTSNDANGNAVITYDAGDTVTLEHVSATQLRAQDFLFV